MRTKLRLRRNRHWHGDSDSELTRTRSRTRRLNAAETSESGSSGLLELPGPVFRRRVPVSPSRWLNLKLCEPEHTQYFKLQVSIRDSDTRGVAVHTTHASARRAQLISILGLCQWILAFRLTRISASAASWDSPGTT